MTTESLERSGTIDLVTAEVIRSAMETICFEMATYVSRTATTPILNQSNERNATILDATGRLPPCRWGFRSSCSARPCPCSSPSSSSAASSSRATCSWPTTRSTAAATCPTSTSSRRSSTRTASCCCSRPSSAITAIPAARWPAATTSIAKDIWSEGVRYPLLKIVDGGKERRDVVLMMRANSRLPGFIGDLRSQVGAAQLGARRLTEIIEQYGASHRARGGRLDDRRRHPTVLRGDRAVAGR